MTKVPELGSDEELEELELNEAQNDRYIGSDRVLFC
jgi:hypothetical protein